MAADNPNSKVELVIKSSKDLEEQFNRILATDPLVHCAMMYYKYQMFNDAPCTMEQALKIAVIALSESNKRLVNMLTERMMRNPLNHIHTDVSFK